MTVVFIMFVVLWLLPIPGIHAAHHIVTKHKEER